MGKVESNTPYDDVCRTLTVECDDLVIPLINEIFGEHYSLEDRILYVGQMSIFWNSRVDQKKNGSQIYFLKSSAT